MTDLKFENRVIPWVASKPVDWNEVQKILQPSLLKNQMTNNGPLIGQLESFFHQHLNIANHKCVIVVNNAANGLNALIGALNIENKKSMKFASQCFTFPCAGQGALQDTVFVDFENTSDFKVDIASIPEDVDGLLVTNLFGHAAHIDTYLAYAKEKNKILIFDNATVPFTQFKGTSCLNYGVGSIVSLHHTKPIGFGEGGLVIVDKNLENNVRRCVNFGFKLNADKTVQWHPDGLNAKMSEIQASFIMQFLTPSRFETMTRHNTMLFSRFHDMLFEGELSKYYRLFPHCDDSVPFVSGFALICEFTVTNEDLAHIFSHHRVEAKKYYTPLKPLEKSCWLFDHILCLPCHQDVAESDLERYIALLQSIILRKKEESVL